MSKPMTQVHPTALIEDGAEIAATATVGPFCIVGSGAQIGEDVRLISHAVVAGLTQIGAGTVIYPFASIGHAPQDLKYQGEATRLEIGSGNTIREHVTINPGTAGGGGVTRVGDGNLIMVGAHIAHDCHVGNGAIIVNNVLLGGHVTIGDNAVIGGGAAIHQFVRIGPHAMIGGVTGVEADVIPYGLAKGNRATLDGLNLVGLKRRGFSRDEIHALRAAFTELFNGETGTLQSRAAEMAMRPGNLPTVVEMLAFVTADTQRQICMPAGR